MVANMSLLIADKLFSISIYGNDVTAILLVAILLKFLCVFDSVGAHSDFSAMNTKNGKKKL